MSGCERQKEKSKEIEGEISEQMSLIYLRYCGFYR